MAETLSSDAASDFRPPPHAVPRRTRGDMWRPGTNQEGGGRYSNHMDASGGGRQRYGAQQSQQGGGEVPDGRQRNEHDGYRNRGGRGRGYDYSQRGGRGDYRTQPPWDQQSQHSHRGGTRRVTRGPPSNPSLNRLSSTDSDATAREQLQQPNRGYGPTGSSQQQMPRNMSVYDQDRVYSQPKQQVTYGSSASGKPPKMGAGQQSPSGLMESRNNAHKELNETPRDSLPRTTGVGNNRSILTGPPPLPQIGKTYQSAISKNAPVETSRPPQGETPPSPSNISKARPPMTAYSQPPPSYAQQPPRSIVQMDTGRVMTSPSTIRPMEQAGPAAAALISGDAHWGPQIAGRVVPVGPHFLSPLAGVMAPHSPMPLPNEGSPYVVLQGHAGAVMETPPQFDPKHRGPNPLLAGPPLKMHNLRLADYAATLSKIRAEKRRALLEREPISHGPSISPTSPPMTPQDNVAAVQTSSPHQRSIPNSGETPVLPVSQASVQQPRIIKYSIDFMLRLKDSPASRDTHLSLPGFSAPKEFNQSQHRGHHTRRRSFAGQHGPSPVEIFHGPRAGDWAHRERNYDDTPGFDSEQPSQGNTSTMPIPAPRVSNKQGLSKEAALQRHVKSLLNKMTVERFVEISNMLSACLEDTENAEQLKIVVDEVYKKSVSEPNFSEMYADLVLVLRARSPQFPNPEPNVKPSDFQRGIVMRCQEEFNDIGDFSKLNLPPAMIEKMNEDDIEIERKTRKIRTLGNMRFIGELFVRRVVTGVALKTILGKLIHEEESPEAHLVECICELLSTIGPAVEAISVDTLDTLCNTLDKLRLASKYENRIGYKIQDLVELRQAGWRQKTVYKQKAKALSEFRQDTEIPEVELVGQESNHPYKEHVRYWNEHFLARKKEAKARRNEEAAAAAAVASAEPAPSSPLPIDQHGLGSVCGETISPLSAVSNGGSQHDPEQAAVLCE